MLDGFLDALQDVAAWFFTAIIAAIGTWVAWVTRAIMGNKTRLSVLEETVKKLPADAAEIKKTLREMREEAGKARDKLYDHMDRVRRELRQDIKDGHGLRRARYDDDHDH